MYDTQLKSINSAISQYDLAQVYSVGIYIRVFFVVAMKSLPQRMDATHSAKHFIAVESPSKRGSNCFHLYSVCDVHFVEC